MSSPLVEMPLFQLGPVPIAGSVLTSFFITTVLGATSCLLTRHLSLRPSRTQAALELLVSTIDAQIRDVLHRRPAAYTPLVGTLFIYLVTANSIAVVPLMESPTARLETTMALALIVFFSVYFYGIRANGLRGYLKHFVEPTPLLAPVHVLSEITRTLALMMRLLGNIMSHGLVLAIVVSLAGLLVPIPIMAFGLFVGLVQAYIFAVLATVYVGAAVESDRSTRESGAPT
jgi:F-type H+-transporting ATPase subunit a